ncbi:hypothetical protein [Armatimonas sp.]|uniref:hypothetical protein n=1 Tax=Armatimonas sp. TaxID=1872638 RepID=UPI00286BAFFD|nr:hypothetical protein [Armatimonas sp.]
MKRALLPLILAFVLGGAVLVLEDRLQNKSQKQRYPLLIPVLVLSVIALFWGFTQLLWFPFVGSNVYFSSLALLVAGFGAVCAGTRRPHLKRRTLGAWGYLVAISAVTNSLFFTVARQWPQRNPLDLTVQLFGLAVAILPLIAALTALLLPRERSLLSDLEHQIRTRTALSRYSLAFSINLGLLFFCGYLQTKNSQSALTTAYYFRLLLSAVAMGAGLWAVQPLWDTEPEEAESEELPKQKQTNPPFGR